ncbi:hypothetical protein F0U60_50350 [Archangium minus]|uniref:Uncharacterized protein n=1 Tax=Archangium minus TaxID=83450 RepID=A0ABY9X7R0_9BACT|nr:hypothetical protein F0U60_50350 [Archangium minus]
MKFVLDVFDCAGSGGRRRVLEYVTALRGGRSIQEHLGRPTRHAMRAPAPGPAVQAARAVPALRCVDPIHLRPLEIQW